MEQRYDSGQTARELETESNVHEHEHDGGKDSCKCAPQQFRRERRACRIAGRNESRKSVVYGRRFHYFGYYLVRHWRTCDNRDRARVFRALYGIDGSSVESAANGLLHISKRRIYGKREIVRKDNLTSTARNRLMSSRGNYLENSRLNLLLKRGIYNFVHETFISRRIVEDV